MPFEPDIKQLFFALERRRKPSVILLVYDKEEVRFKVLSELKHHFKKQYEFLEVDIPENTPSSLHRYLSDTLPANAKKKKEYIEYIVSINNLDQHISYYDHGELKPTPFLWQLNMEREDLFRKMPIVIILWVTPHTRNFLQREAPDLWHWITYHFVLDTPDSEEVMALNMAYSNAYSNAYQVVSPEKKKRIKQLQKRYEKLDYKQEPERLAREQMSLLSLLAKELAESFDYEKSMLYYEQLLHIYKQFGQLVSNEQYVRTLLEYGNVALEKRDLNLALQKYEVAIDYTEDQGVLAALYHNMGYIFSLRKEWDEALSYYEKSIKLLKNELRSLVAQAKLRTLLRKLEQIISPQSELYDVFLNASTRFNRIKREEFAQIMSSRDYELARNKLMHTLLSIIEDMSIEDIKQDKLFLSKEVETAKQVSK